MLFRSAVANVIIVCYKEDPIWAMNVCFKHQTLKFHDFADFSDYFVSIPESRKRKINLCLTEEE